MPSLWCFWKIRPDFFVNFVRTYNHMIYFSILMRLFLMMLPWCQNHIQKRLPFVCHCNSSRRNLNNEPAFITSSNQNRIIMRPSNSCHAAVLIHKLAWTNGHKGNSFNNNSIMRLIKKSRAISKTCTSESAPECVFDLLKWIRQWPDHEKWFKCRCERTQKKLCYF
jgi:hypothetical protein